MIIWIILFLVVAVISFLLAVKSMRNYREKPSYFTTPYSLFLVQKPQNLTDVILSQIGNGVVEDKLMVSFERLFKGGRSALVIFAPTSVISPFILELGLLELEEYSNKVSSFKIWEFGVRPNSEVQLDNLKINKDDLPLSDMEQFWYQLVTRYQADGKLRSSLRVVIQSLDPHRLNQLEHQVNQLFSEANLVALPKAINSTRMLKHYQERAFSGWLVAHKESMVLDLLQIRKLLLLG